MIHPVKRARYAAGAAAALLAVGVSLTGSSSASATTTPALASYSTNYFALFINDTPEEWLANVNGLVANHLWVTTVATSSQPQDVLNLVECGQVAATVSVKQYNGGGNLVRTYTLNAACISDITYNAVTSTPGLYSVELDFVFWSLSIS